MNLTNRDLEFKIKAKSLIENKNSLRSDEYLDQLENLVHNFISDEENSLKDMIKDQFSFFNEHLVPILIKLLNEINTVIYIKEEERFTFINKAFDKIFGIDKNLVYKDKQIIQNLVLPEYLPLFQYDFNDPSQIKYEYRIKRPDGEIRWMGTHNYPILNENQKVIGRFGIINDITERKLRNINLKESIKKIEFLNSEYLTLNEEYKSQNEELRTVNEELTESNERYRIINEQLTESEKNYELLFNEMISAFAFHEMIYDEKGNPLDYRYLRVNKAFTEFTGLKEVEGKRVLEILPNLEKTWIDTFGNVAKTGVPIRYENYVKELDKYYDVTAYSPKKNFFAVTFTDVTSKRKAEKLEQEIISNREESEIEKRKTILALQESEFNFRQLAENITDVFALWGADSKIIYVSPRFESILGWPRELFIQNPWEFLNWIHPEDRDRIVKTFQDSRLTLKIDLDLKFRIIKPDQQIISIWYREQTVFDQNKSPYRRAAIVTDITEQVIAEEELLKAKSKAEESDKLKSIFLANMSHEIRTPMNGIIGFAGLLDDENLPIDRRRRFIDIIQNSTNQLLTIITDIVDISKIETSLVELDIESCNLNTIMNDLFTQFEMVLKEKEKKQIHLIMSNNLHDTKNIIKTDEVRLKQILNNLLSNAIKFTEMGYIEFGAEFIPSKGIDSDSLIRFHVRDTGIGIAPDRQQIIFERFRQEDESFTRKYGGTGLGLAICKGLVSLLNGKIWVESEKGKGSTFFFTIPHIPVEVNKVYNASSLLTSTKKYDWRNKTILIVDDVEDVYLLFLEIFNGTKASCLYANCGMDAIEMCKNNQEIDIVLMDIQLPDINGFDTTIEIKKVKPDLPILAQTAYALSGDKEKALKAGCDDYISKPINRHLLFDKIDKLLNIK